MTALATIPAQLIPVPSGTAGVRATLRVMVKLAKQYKTHPTIRELAKGLVGSCAPRDQWCEVTQLQHFVRDHVRYTLDVHGVETVQTPLNTLGYIEQPDGTWVPNGSPPVAAGDCDDSSTLLAALLLSIGIPGAFCAVAVNDETEFSHVLVEARLAGVADYVPLETIVAGAEPGWFPPDATCQMLAHFG